MVDRTVVDLTGIKPNTRVIEYKLERAGLTTNKRALYTVFKSIDSFLQYANGSTPTNSAFRTGNCVSLVTKDQSYIEWNDTKSYEEAISLLRNGYEVGVEKLMAELKAQTHEEPAEKPRNTYGVAGFQCSVPRYLQGIPTNMIAKKQEVIHKKVITVNKCIDYSGSYSAKQITEYSVRTLRLIQALEKAGFAVNLNVLDGLNYDWHDYDSNRISKEFLQIRVKNANEPLNIRKLAFPLVNASMLRRITFRYYEVTDTANLLGNYTNSYGMIIQDRDYHAVYNQLGEIYLNRALEEEDLNKLVFDFTTNK